MKITIECTEEQANLIVKSLEALFRTEMSQPDFIADILAEDSTDEPHGKHFDLYILKREDIEIAMKAVTDIAYGKWQAKVSDECHNISDIWSCLRHALFMYQKPKREVLEWDVRGREPIQLGTMPLPKIEIEGE